jgi:hypothetical protein
MAPVPDPLMTSRPQFEIQPYVLGAAVPGGPVLVSIQKSLVISALPPDIAASVERTRVQLSNIRSISGRLGAWLLRATHCVGNGGGKRGSPFAQAHDSILVQRVATIPPPGILVKVFEFLPGKPVFCSKAVAVVISLGLVCMARAILI